MLPPTDVCRALVTTHYGDRRAARSGLLLIKHIDDGLVLLHDLGASVVAQQAWCLHPLVQDDAALLHHTRDSSLLDLPLPGAAVAMAMEYRAVANAFLSHHIDDDSARPQTGPLPEVRWLLIADKVQNRADFEVHHAHSHPRAAQLARYFRVWLEALGVNEDEYNRMAGLLRSDAESAAPSDRS